MWYSASKKKNFLNQSAICFILLLSIGNEFGVLECSRCYSFSISLGRLYGYRIHTHSQEKHTLGAKPKPTSNFDLASIEAFEAAAYSEDDENTGDIDDDVDGPSSSTEEENTQTLSISDELNGKRIDAALASVMENTSRSASGNLVANGCVRQVVTKEGEEVEELISRKSFKVEAGMTLKVTIPKTDIPEEIIPQNIPLKILYEDEHMIVLNKDAGMVVHPAAGNWDGTVVNALAYYLANDSPYGMSEFVSSNNEEEDEKLKLRPGIVHRLDKGTTGILIVSKTKAALAKLSESFAKRRVRKTYLAITVGNPGRRVKIDKPIGRHPIHRQRMRVVPDPHRTNSRNLVLTKGSTSTSKTGKRAVSFVETLHFDSKLSLVKVRIETGRTHQIRVHLQDRHTPIYGDDLYGISDWNQRLRKGSGIERPLLHAHRLEIEHPVTRERMMFVAPMADDMVAVARGVWPDGATELPEAYNTMA